jgi:UDP-2,3-diacylglucosamine hydrolase
VRQVALLAGEGVMPQLILEEAKACGVPVFLLAIKGVASPVLPSLASETKWLSLTQLGTAIKECVKRDITEITLAGRVKHASVFSFSFLKTDWTTFSTLIHLSDWRTDSLLKGVADLFEKKEVHMVSSVKYLKKFLASLSKKTKREPSEKDLKTIHLGIEAAKTLGKLDIGQTVVVKDGMIVAVEGMEGTDKCLERAEELVGKGVIVIKLAKPNQDMRFDVPTIGRNTLDKLIKIKAKGIVLESDKTLILDANFTEEAEKNKIFVHVIES